MSNIQVKFFNKIKRKKGRQYWRPVNNSR